MFLHARETTELSKLSVSTVLKISVKSAFYVILSTFYTLFKTHPVTTVARKKNERNMSSPLRPATAFQTLPTPRLICILRTINNR